MESSDSSDSGGKYHAGLPPRVLSSSDACLPADPRPYPIKRDAIDIMEGVMPMTDTMEEDEFDFGFDTPPTSRRFRSTMLAPDANHLHRPLPQFELSELEVFSLRKGAQRPVTDAIRHPDALDLCPQSVMMEMGVGDVPPPLEHDHPNTQRPAQLNFEGQFDGTNNGKSSEEYYECHESGQHWLAAERQFQPDMFQPKVHPLSETDTFQTSVYRDAQPSKAAWDEAVPLDSIPAYQKYTPDAQYQPPEVSDTLVDATLREGAWGSQESDFIKPFAGPQFSEIPNCSASRERKYWRMTDSSLKAYTAMRGPDDGVGRNMFVWMDHCRNTYREPKECDETVGSCAEYVATPCMAEKRLLTNAQS